MAHAPRPGAPHRGTIAGLARRGHLHDLDADRRRNAVASGAASTNAPPPARRVTVRHVVKLAIVPSLVGRGRNRSAAAAVGRGRLLASSPWAAAGLSSCTATSGLHPVTPASRRFPTCTGMGTAFEIFFLSAAVIGAHRTGRAPAASSRPTGCARGCRGPGCAVPRGSRQPRGKADGHRAVPRRAWRLWPSPAVGEAIG